MTGKIADAIVDSRDPEAMMMRALMLMRGASIRAGRGFITIETTDTAAAVALGICLTGAQAADKKLGEASGHG